MHPKRITIQIGSVNQKCYMVRTQAIITINYVFELVVMRKKQLFSLLSKIDFISFVFHSETLSLRYTTTKDFIDLNFIIIISLNY